ncbi:MAG: Na/Pi cotransporter family protein [Bacillota bacterium]|nr:Na/Pi cotransporter family protein [Bacillota bacterium]
MDIFSILNLIGGLAMFLYGMNVMGKGLETLAGSKLEQILEKMTSNRLKAALLGTGVTAVIQSSSAATVMVIGLVNSKIMKLRQAIGVILGAKIGTTVTAWLLSLTGISSTFILLQLCKPSSFSPVLAAVGIVFLMFMKSERKHHLGIIFIGFAVLMFGMETMSAAMAPLKDMPQFAQIMTMFSNPLFGLLAGMALTAVIQSSSASIGILQALSLTTGSITTGIAIPIVMGQNIGTCVTAMLASIGTSKNAKRAAFAHLISTTIGALVFLTVFYSLNAVVGFEFLSEVTGPAGIAAFHTIFNVILVSCWLPLTGVLEKIVCTIVKDETDGEDTVVTEEADFSMLDERFLMMPSFALRKAYEVTVRMAHKSGEALMNAMDLLESYDKDKAEKVFALEDEVDRFEDKIGTYLVKLSRENISSGDSHSLSMLLNCIGDFERISDHAVNLAQAAEEKSVKGLDFSPAARNELRVFSDSIREIVENTIDVFENEDGEKALLVEPLEEVVDDLNLEMKSRHITRLRDGECTIELGFLLSDITTNFERVADHCSNIAIHIIQIDEDAIEAHGYLDTLKREENPLFKKKYAEYRDKYRLPKIN